MEELEREGRIIELRAYDTIHGIWKYFTVNDDQIDLEHQNYLIIGTLESYLKIHDYFGKRESCADLYRSGRRRTPEPGVKQGADAGKPEV